ncbi:MAG TPA: hypothetical protein VFH58_08360 [Acidimicrobiales bacterium]|nr:hypothetical protein [Acidimicrobiales bacterium]
MRNPPRVRTALAALGALAGLTLFPAVSLEPAPSATAATSSPGYWLEASDGGVFSFNTHFYGSALSPTNPCRATTPNGACYSMAATKDGGGYWLLVASSGKVLTFGDAVSYGQPADTPAYQGPGDFWPQSTQIVPTSTGKGYWVLETGLSGLGSVQGFGDAKTFGDEVTTAHQTGHAGWPVALVGTADDQGYWIVDNDGGVFSFGDAVFYGSMGGHPLSAPVLAAAGTPDRRGYWLAGSDGGVFSFGDAHFGGSVAGFKLAAPVIAMAANPSGPGYWLAAVDGGVFALGGAPFLGSMGGVPLDRPVYSMVATANGAG